MKKILLFVAALGFFVSSNASALLFPRNPDTRITPGQLCERADSYRYPERIAYCTRNVSREEKQSVIAEYNETLNFNIQAADRSQFKIDHLIPLCAGGSNDRRNLWPQHQSVYALTDPLEGPLCGKMSEGKLSQKHAVELILRAKLNLDQVDAVAAELHSL